MRKRLILLAAILFTVSFVVTESEGATGKNAPAVTLKLGHVTVTSHPYHLTALKFAELVKEKSGGNVKIEIFPSAQLGGDRDMFEMVQKGALDIGFISTGVIGSFSEPISGLQLPFLMENVSVLKAFYTSDVPGKILAQLEKDTGVKSLAIFDSGFRHIVSRKPINDISDLKIMKMRSVESPLINDIFKALGTNPTPMPLSEVYTSLQTGVIDCLEMGPAGMYAYKYYEVAPNYTLTAHYTFPFAGVMSQATWDKISADQRKVIMAAAQETIVFSIDISKQEDEKYLQMLRKIPKLKVVELKDFRKFKEAVKPVYSKYMANSPLIQETVKKVEQIKAGLK